MNKAEFIEALARQDRVTKKARSKESIGCLHRDRNRAYV